MFKFIFTWWPRRLFTSQQKSGNGTLTFDLLNSSTAPLERLTTPRMEPDTNEKNNQSENTLQNLVEISVSQQSISNPYEARESSPVGEEQELSDEEENKSDFDQKMLYRSSGKARGQQQRTNPSKGIPKPGSSIQSESGSSIRTNSQDRNTIHIPQQKFIEDYPNITLHYGNDIPSPQEDLLYQQSLKNYNYLN